MFHRKHLSSARRAVALFVRPNAPRVQLTLVVALAVAVLSATEPLLLKAVVDRLTAAQVRGTLGGLVASVTLFGAVLACRIAGNALQTSRTWAVRLNIEFQLRSRVAAKLSVLSPRTQAQIGTGGLRHAVDVSAPHLATAFTDIAYGLTPIVVYVALSAWGMARLNGALTAMVLCVVPLPAIVATLAARRQTRRDRMHQRFWMRLWSWYGEVLHGMATVRAFANERAEERRFVRRVKWAFGSIQRGIHLDALVTSTAALCELLARLAVLGYGGFLVVDGQLSVGALLAFLGYIGGVFAPVQTIIGLYPTIRKAVVALDAVFAVLDAEDEAPDVPDARTAPSLRGEVRFEGVRFEYHPGRPAIDALDLVVAPGQTVALVGPSGSGKSTMLRLLQRQHHPDAGRVLLDGVDVRGLQIASVRRQLGVVPQEVVLFSDSVAANIAYGRPSATRAEVEAAARAANAHEFIVQLPGGYDHRLGEGGRGLSGGQRQRIAIARAFLVDPAVLLLDEATAALDTESEHAVQGALRSLRAGRTTFIVAHRLNTVRDADRIVVLRDGRIVGDGAHDTLVESCPTYAALVRHQLAAPTSDAPDEVSLVRVA
ncbi:ABC transporter related protein [Gemmatirosa kalamazoonensis]|uniref:ABC transporter related protein n=1 Tax=Gemmatirosa kalamazoonensis TaxID=861299 RepID=W0RKY2_9BACT|nr:ABC transporter ATP-binding protein [Gemmatirosa kalamazoonensis]AHG91102.1 ABC transporter related protein [Gemmatirosa kalamazoonensis]